jgi:hypothetical protein
MKCQSSGIKNALSYILMDLILMQFSILIFVLHILYIILYLSLNLNSLNCILFLIYKTKTVDIYLYLIMEVIREYAHHHTTRF